MVDSPEQEGKLRIARVELPPDDDSRQLSL